jgi:FkbM family methyltransferase
MNYKSQYNQDRFLNEKFFHNKKNGVFIDIGAHDGVSLSNSYFFEKELNWKGMCVEPIPTLFEQLDKNRECVKVQGCAWNQDGVKKFRVIKGYAEMLSGIIETYDSSHIKRIENECESTNGSYEDLDIPCYDINGLLKKNGFFNIDFLSIDTEGSEFEILKKIDFKKFDIGIIIVENNYNNNELREFLKSNNYGLFTKLSVDDVFVKQ